MQSVRRPGRFDGHADVAEQVIVNKQKILQSRRQRRKYSVRKRLRGTASDRGCACFAAARILACQLIDDATGRTLVRPARATKACASRSSTAVTATRPKSIGQIVAQRALEAGIKMVRFDRGCYKYHGRVAALADAAREAGLEF